MQTNPEFLSAQPPEQTPEELEAAKTAGKYIDKLRRLKLKGLLQTGIFRSLSPGDVERLTKD